MVSSSFRVTSNNVISRRERSCARFPLFYPCFKIFGFYERARGVHKLYDILCDVEKERVKEKEREIREEARRPEYNVPSAFSPGTKHRQ